MPKAPVSVTLEEDNLLWLRARVTGSKRRSLSEAIDDVVTAARLGGHPAHIRSVVGTVDISASDPGLDEADDYLSSIFHASVSRPFLVRETPPPYGPKKRTKRRG
jgi:hypothetical protein